jgi:tRNA G18 (ribose-2'-O)-methylase SpoU
MPVIRVERLDDRRLDDYRNVADADLLRHRNLFVAEGRLVVGRLLNSAYQVVSALVNDASFHALETELQRLSIDAPVFVCETGDFASITGFNLHRGCLALGARPPSRALDDLAGGRLLLVLEAVTDADNVGSAFRNAAAFGADGIVLSPTCCDPFYRKAVRTSMGSVFRTPFVRSAAWPDDLARLKAAGFTIVALTPEADAIPLPLLEVPAAGPRFALLVGTEGAGLSGAVRPMADLIVRIPMAPDIDSVNLATASGIALYHLASRGSTGTAPGQA